MKMDGYEKQNRACFKKKVTFGKNFWGWNWNTHQKQKERNSETRDNNTPSTNKSSTERVRKHRENKRLIVSVPFKLSRSAQKILLR